MNSTCIKCEVNFFPFGILWDSFEIFSFGLKFTIFFINIHKEARQLLSAVTMLHWQNMEGLCSELVNGDRSINIGYKLLLQLNMILYSVNRFGIFEQFILNGLFRLAWNFFPRNYVIECHQNLFKNPMDLYQPVCVWPVGFTHTYMHYTVASAVYELHIYFLSLSLSKYIYIYIYILYLYIY